AKVLVITGYGTNCERETAHAAREAGADRVDIRFFSDLVSEKAFVLDYNLLIFPGGFLDGDELGAAQAASLRWRYSRTKSGRLIFDDLKEFVDRGNLILGICNGFQLMVKLGLLPSCGGKRFERQVSLSYNDSARFEDRWVHLAINPDSPCVFTKGIERMYLPIRHGEGKLALRDPELLGQISRENLIAMQYIDPESGEPTQNYPANPNGSPLGIAGLTAPGGRLFGLMPHPEAYNHRTNHPGWTRGESAIHGTELLAGGVRYLQSN
ncbi:MAG: phosphoribosylformylglycinamidine synthase subunit PurQ, partial [Desulfonatronovibrionaceae bacterium]